MHDQIREDLSSFNFTQKYARFVKEKNRRETWEEACERVLKMHLTKYANKGPVVRGMLEWASSYEKEKRVLSSQRARQFGGAPTLLKNWRIYNCTTSYCDRARFFQEAFWLLLCGCGVGFSVQRHHVERLPKLMKLEDWKALPEYAFVVPDTIEGWADSLGELIYSRMGLRSGKPVFDLSNIRPKGSALSIGGKAPGPEPLKVCLEKCEYLLSSVQALRPIDCFDLIMFASDAVLSGGVRRAASIALFSADDTEMMSSKTGNWWQEQPQRARANISAVITPSTSKETYSTLFSKCKEFGEPGFIFSKSTEFVYNPCVEIGMAPILIRDEKGAILDKYSISILENRNDYEELGYTYKSGWQACNLTEVNCSKFTNKEDALEAVKAATILGTAQAGYVESDYLGRTSKLILEREALIGVSLTGMANASDIAFDPDWQQEAAIVSIDTNRKFSSYLGIRHASRTTCVKPSGNAAVLLGCASGIHPEYAKKYIRNVQVSGDNPVVKFFKRYVPDAISESQWAAPGSNDVVISFPLLNTTKAIYRKEVSAEEFIDMVLLTQKNWVRTGRAENRVESLNHNVSNTILVSPQEWDSVKEKLWNNRDKLTGVSLLASFGDYVYEQPPFLEIHDDPQVGTDYYDKMLVAKERWERLREVWKSPKYTLLKESEDVTSLVKEAACTGGACEFTLGV